MTRRRVHVALVSLALLVAVGIVAALVTPRDPRPGDGITPEAVAAVQPGLTYAEVQELMGCPPGAYVTDKNYGRITGFCLTSSNSNGVHEEFWGGRHAGVCVYFSADDIAARIIVCDVTDKKSDLLDSFHRLWDRVTPW